MKSSAVNAAPKQAPSGPPGKAAFLTEVCFAAALLAATLATYHPVWHGGILWDDEGHLTKPELQSLDGLYKIWLRPGETQQYYPFTHTIFWVQHWLWGNDTLGYHLVNIVLHVTGAVLFCLVLRKLKIPGAYLAATIFALHPVHVESVAWISELKNTLSGVLYLGAALTYLQYDEHRKKGTYWSAFGLFVLALASKTVTASLPAALLVVFWWQRGRLEWRRDVFPLLPFFVYAATMGLFSAWMEFVTIGAYGPGFEATRIERFLIAGRAAWFYAEKLIWPVDLMFFYPRWEINQSVWWQYLYPLAACALLLGLWVLRKRTRAPLAAALFFGGTLFPVLGFFNVYPFIFSFVADHFQYLASLGLITLAAAGIALLAARWWPRAQQNWPLVFVTLALAGILATLSWQQAWQYVEIETLYRETIKRNPKAWLCHYNLGMHAYKRGEYQEAVDHIQESVQIKSDYWDSHFDLANSLYHLDRHEEAITHYRIFVQHVPNDVRAYFYIGFSYERLGRLDDAANSYRQALVIEPATPGIHFRLGNVLAKQGRLGDAVMHLEASIQLQPDFEDAINRLREVRKELDASKASKKM